MRNIYKEQVLSFKLKSGREVELKSFQLDLTYHEWIEGVPDKTSNKECIEKIIPPDHWRKTPVLKILPDEHLINTFLPPFYCIALFESFEGILSEELQSELTVIWFLSELNSGSLLEIIQKSIADIDWDSQAEECELI